MPEYTVRISSRSKRPALRIMPGPRLEIVLPKNVAPSAGKGIAEALLRKNEQWIKKHCRRMVLETPLQETGLPESFLLRGGSETVLIRKLSAAPFGPAHTAISHKFADKLSGIGHSYIEIPENEKNTGCDSGIAKATVLYIPDQLASDPQTAETGYALLRQWAKAGAKRLFAGLLEELAPKGGFRYTGPDVRINKSRWGSCSAKKNIIMNACALFLPDALIRHILVHELCHTKEMNHQEGFWREMFRLDPDALKHEKQLRKAWRHVPGWMLR